MRQCDTGRYWAWCGWAIAALASVWLAGCTTVYPRLSSGTGTFVWPAQRLEWLYPYPLEDVRVATLAALAVLKYNVAVQHFDGLGGELAAQPLLGQQVYIHADPLSPLITRLQVRVPGAGGRIEAERIHATIRSQLGM